MTAISLIIPTVDWGPTFACCLQSAWAALSPGDELLVVFDGVLCDPPRWLVDSGASLLSTGHRQGPAAARNVAAASASTELLVFVDADVQLHADALSLIRRRFAADPGLTAVFGSYDDHPAAPGLVSRFRNLLHHHTHSSHPGPATTFWAGLGAIRRVAFESVGGFDALAYARPSIEDIELGLRLHDSGARIELDPSIQGIHHKRWTLRTMLITDIRQRAIPWSRLLLERRELPATLNLNRVARVSAAASLLLFAALPAALLWPDLSTWMQVLFSCSLALLLGLNQPFHRLLVGRLGWLHGCVGIALHAFYLAYSSFTFVLVAVWEWLRQPLRPPEQLQMSPGLRRGLITAGLALLFLFAGLVLSNGLLLASTSSSRGDLVQRFDEWRLFQAGIYPSRQLATAAEQAIPYFRTTVYLPWALPLFAPLFARGDFVHGKLITQTLNLVALLPIALIGWRSLRPWGTAAAWLGGLAPVAIAGNSNCLGHPQFSMICMGLISLQWWLQKRGFPMPAGLCWALAMLKPQIAAPFALTLLLSGQRRGLAIGLALLTALSALALLHTQTSPIAFAASWIQVLPYFVGSNNQNLLAWLVSMNPSAPFSALGWTVLIVPTIIIIITAMVVSRPRGYALRPSTLLYGGQFFHQGYIRATAWCTRAWGADPLSIAAVLAVVGQLGFYHAYYDNILLFPALLACWRRLLQRLTRFDGLLTVLTAATLWTPQRLLDLWPAHATAQATIWSGLGVVLAWDLLARFWGERPSPRADAFST